MSDEIVTEESLQRAMSVIEAARVVVMRSFGTTHAENPELVMQAVRLILACAPKRPPDNRVVAFDPTRRGD